MKRLRDWLTSATVARAVLRIVSGLTSDAALMGAVYLATGAGFWRCLLVALLFNVWAALRRFAMDLR